MRARGPPKERPAKTAGPSGTGGWILTAKSGFFMVSVFISFESGLRPSSHQKCWPLGAIKNHSKEKEKMK